MLDTKFVCTRGKVTEDRHGSGDNTNDIVRATRDRLHSRSHHVTLYMTHFMLNGSQLSHVICVTTNHPWC